MNATKTVDEGRATSVGVDAHAESTVRLVLHEVNTAVPPNASHIVGREHDFREIEPGDGVNSLLYTAKRATTGGWTIGLQAGKINASVLDFNPLKSLRKFCRVLHFEAPINNGPGRSRRATVCSSQTAR